MAGSPSALRFAPIDEFHPAPRRSALESCGDGVGLVAEINFLPLHCGARASRACSSNASVSSPVCRIIRRSRRRYRRPLKSSRWALASSRAWQKPLIQRSGDLRSRDTAAVKRSSSPLMTSNSPVQRLISLHLTRQFGLEPLEANFRFPPVSYVDAGPDHVRNRPVFPDVGRGGPGDQAAGAVFGYPINLIGLVDLPGNEMIKRLFHGVNCFGSRKNLPEKAALHLSQGIPGEPLAGRVQAIDASLAVQDQHHNLGRLHEAVGKIPFLPHHGLAEPQVAEQQIIRPPDPRFDQGPVNQEK